MSVHRRIPRRSPVSDPLQSKSVISPIDSSSAPPSPSDPALNSALSSLVVSVPSPTFDPAAIPSPPLLTSSSVPPQQQHVPPQQQHVPPQQQRVSPQQQRVSPQQQRVPSSQDLQQRLAQLEAQFYKERADHKKELAVEKKATNLAKKFVKELQEQHKTVLAAGNEKMKQLEQQVQQLQQAPPAENKDTHETIHQLTEKMEKLISDTQRQHLTIQSQQVQIEQYKYQEQRRDAKANDDDVTQIRKLEAEMVTLSFNGSLVTHPRAEPPNPKKLLKDPEVIKSVKLKELKETNWGSLKTKRELEDREIFLREKINKTVCDMKKLLHEMDQKAYIIFDALIEEAFATSLLDKMKTHRTQQSADALIARKQAEEYRIKAEELNEKARKLKRKARIVLDDEEDMADD